MWLSSPYHPTLHTLCPPPLISILAILHGVNPSSLSLFIVDLTAFCLPSRMPLLQNPGSHHLPLTRLDLENNIYKKAKQNIPNILTDPSQVVYSANVETTGPSMWTSHIWPAVFGLCKTIIILLYQISRRPGQLQPALYDPRAAAISLSGQPRIWPYRRVHAVRLPDSVWEIPAEWYRSKI